MNTGMQDAFNLAWKLRLVIGGVCKPSLLDSYSVERSAVGDMVLRNASRLTDAAIVRNPILQGLRNTVVKFALGFPQLGHRVADLLAELNIGYPKSPLTVEGAHRASGTKAGARWPERLPADPGKARFTAMGPADAVAGAGGKVSQAGAGGTGFRPGRRAGPHPCPARRLCRLCRRGVGSGRRRSLSQGPGGRIRRLPGSADPPSRGTRLSVGFSTRVVTGRDIACPMIE